MAGPAVLVPGTVGSAIDLLRGLSTGDFRPTLETLLGEEAAGLSATNIARLTGVWEEEYREFRKPRLEDRDYVYVWADGVHFNVRLEDERRARARHSGHG